MQIYLVGGAVRDQLLGYPFHERDWVVVGATPAELLSQGYQQVGKDFPVFLHPKTKEEYALARTERKAGSGYTGFTVYAAPDVTLEQDLARRDLTINAIAQDAAGNYIDPFHGRRDIEQKQLRHVSDAFVEDPLRVLRVARFYARYAHLGFTVAPETLALMTQLSQHGELTTLSAERVWVETAKALNTEQPAAYFQLLQQCGALSVLMPELAAFWGVPQPEKWHPEIDSGIHSLLVLQQAATLSQRLDIRFAALVHDVGKGLTPTAELPAHHGHEHRGLALITALCKRLRVPNDCRDLALLVCEYHQLIHRAAELNAKTVLKLFNAIDLWRKPERLSDILLCCTADLRGRTGFEQEDYPPAMLLPKLAEAAMAVSAKALITQGITGPAIKEALQQARLQAISHAQQTLNGN
ncbi:multifunctional CCA addition/repair protein [Alishewanella sp. SMS8]|uniref:multifunctional CCA addition/repair protein n=1 Tax=Alishewanella sp. SMS8 TaxID=2994676 RepID=UPI0027425A59|nr:multifunctional CCA addition/repair protein [Alishewanella sp. SMS8]MDP5205916.1 multifunctional CCA addition/repair protein [Alishewanella sp. SMS9]MDP5459662.1 multifunctional CCA addition/repair protein [Alishewanella sp. SMS8]